MSAAITMRMMRPMTTYEIMCLGVVYFIFSSSIITEVNNKRRALLWVRAAVL